MTARMLKSFNIPVRLVQLLRKHVKGGNRSSFVSLAIAEHLTLCLLKEAENEKLTKESLKEIIKDAKTLRNITKKVKEDLNKHGRLRALILKDG